MFVNLAIYIALALQQPATIYGYGEPHCGDYGTRAVACNSEATTASGRLFNPNDLTVAIPLPRSRRIQPTNLRIKSLEGPCITVTITDKKNERYIGTSGFDLTPATVRALIGKEPTPYWSGLIYQCSSEEK